jgi:hypothetical protein
MTVQWPESIVLPMSGRELRFKPTGSANNRVITVPGSRLRTHTAGSFYRESRCGLTIIGCQAEMIANFPETRVLEDNQLTAPELQERLEEIIRRMQKIQRSIQASRQPASRLELMELRDLGVEYAHIIEQLSDLPDAGGD